MIRSWALEVDGKALGREGADAGGRRRTADGATDAERHGHTTRDMRDAGREVQEDQR